jgi:hypothetical protein
MGFNAATESAQRHDCCRAILFLMDHPGLAWVPGKLCGALKQKGYSSSLSRLQEASNTAPHTYRQTVGCDFWLAAATTTAAVAQYNFNHVVLLVPAGMESVLAAYRRIQEVADPNPPDIGVVLVGPRDQRSAWQHFRQLAVGALRHLGVPLLNLGFLPEQPPSQRSPTKHHLNDALAGISERLLRSEFYTPYPVQALNHDRDQSPRIVHLSVAEGRLI